MPDVTSAPFRFRALPVTTATWSTIPNQQGYEGATTTVDVSSYYIDGMPVTTDFSVTLYSDSGGTIELTNTHDLYDVASINDDTQIITFDLSSVDISSNTDVYVRVTGHQPDP